MTQNFYKYNYNRRLERSPEGLAHLGFRTVKVLKICRLLYHKQGDININTLTRGYEVEDIYAAIEDGLIELVRGLGPRLTLKGEAAYVMALQWGKGSVGWFTTAGEAAQTPDVLALRVQQMREGLHHKYDGTDKWSGSGKGDTHRVVIGWDVKYGPKAPGKGGPPPPVEVIKYYKGGRSRVYHPGDVGWGSALKLGQQWINEHKGRKYKARQ